MEHSAIPYRRLAAVVAGFCALSSVGGAIELLVWPTGNHYVPGTLLEHTPFDTFVVPGLLLGIVVAGASFAAAALILRRSRAAAEMTTLAGATLVVWIVAEVALLRDTHPLHVLYGGLGLVLLWLGSVACWRSPGRRLRWLLVVTWAEAIGFAIPAAVGVAAASQDVAPTTTVVLLVCAGAVEGLVLGTGQALAFPLPLRRARFAALTATAAGAVWALAMMIHIVLPSLPTAAQIAVGAVATTVGLGAIGTAQWVELRHHGDRAPSWIGWTALAWAAALPMSFLPGPLVDASTPVLSVVLLWACAGLVMAHVMARITWIGVARLVDTPPHQKGTPCRKSSSSTQLPKVRLERSPTTSVNVFAAMAPRWWSAMSRKWTWRTTWRNSTA